MTPEGLYFKLRSVTCILGLGVEDSHKSQKNVAILKMFIYFFQKASGSHRGQASNGMKASTLSYYHDQP